MATRHIHQVRCRKPGDPQTFVDVAVVDSMTLTGPNGQQVLIYFTAKKAQPFIRDKTGDGNGKGDSKTSTRRSHMERVHGTADENQKFDIEVLDAVCFKPPMIRDPRGRGGNHTRNRNAHLRDMFGFGQYNGTNTALMMPSGQRAEIVVDRTGLGLNKSDDNPSRKGHVNLVTEKGDSDTNSTQADSTPPQDMTWCATVKMDAIVYKGQSGKEICLVMPKSGIAEVDTTKMTTDPATGDPCPPDNSDPNVYIGWPADGSSAGTNVGIPFNETSKKVEPINQGMLWYIKKTSKGFRPWFWFADVQEYRAFSFFGAPPEIADPKWGYRGFVLFDNFPVIWILSVNNPLHQMGFFGSESLDLCAEHGDWDGLVPPTPSGNFSVGTGEFGPFGLLPMTHKPFEDDPWKGRLNIWQLTGLQQPPRKDGSKPFDPFTNTYREPSKALAEECAHSFRDKWNAVSEGCNALLESYQPDGRVDNIDQPPGWDWAVPWYDGFQPAFRSSFQNSIQPGIFTAAIPAVLYVPATCWTMSVDQLDPAKWDTSKMEFNRNPINYFLPIIGPPTKWPPHP